MRWWDGTRSSSLRWMALGWMAGWLVIVGIEVRNAGHTTEGEEEEEENSLLCIAKWKCCCCRRLAIRYEKTANVVLEQHQPQYRQKSDWVWEEVDGDGAGVVQLYNIYSKNWVVGDGKLSTQIIWKSKRAIDTAECRCCNTVYSFLRRRGVSSPSFVVLGDVALRFNYNCNPTHINWFASITSWVGNKERRVGGWDKGWGRSKSTDDQKWWTMNYCLSVI